MKSKPARSGKPGISTALEVHIGAAGTLVGHLNYVSQGRREVSQFAYDENWLANPERFEFSPDLPLEPGYQPRRAPNPVDSVFHFALADTAPDAWGRRVINRIHAKARKDNPRLLPLNELDYLCAVDDFSRIGALRLCNEGIYLRTVDEGRRTTPPIIELERMYKATRAVETTRETVEDLRYLQGKGTSLGGMRPKCTVLDENGKLAIGKFPSVNDTINVTRAEVLALKLARQAGITTANARCVTLNDTPVAIIERLTGRTATCASLISRLRPCFRPRGRMSTPTPRSSMSCSKSARIRTTTRESYGAAWFSTCSSPTPTTICKTSVFCMTATACGAFRRRST
jgi:serine/threonine-protein kinase HipA